MRIEQLCYRAEIGWTKLKHGLARFVLGKAKYDSLVRRKLYARVVAMKSREPEEQFVGHFISEGSKCIDIGAFYGEFTCLFSRLCGKTGTVLAIEPIGSNYDILVDLVAHFQLNNVITRQIGIGAETGFGRMEFPVTFGIAQTAVARMVTCGEAEPLRQAQQVRISTIDEIFAELQWKKLDFIKCDIEGAELQMLRGGEKTISQHRPTILMEVVEKWLNKYGHHTADVFNSYDRLRYSAFRLENGLLRAVGRQDRSGDERVVQNFFFLPTERLGEYSNLIV